MESTGYKQSGNYLHTFLNNVELLLYTLYIIKFGTIVLYIW
jgi:hypothetical protein